MYDAENNYRTRIFGAILATSFCLFVPLALSNGPPKSVILIIGDGMDDQQITIARNYLKGAQGYLLLDEMPFRGVSQVLTIDENSGLPVYVADSANTATSLATGEVTSRGRIATSAKEDLDLVTIAELAHEKDYKIGLVTTSSVTDATPAAFMTHISNRFCESPDEMRNAVKHGIHLGSCMDDLRANGGPGSISEQLANAPIHVLLGGGLKYFKPNVEDGEYTVLQSAIRNGYTFLESLNLSDTVKPSDRILGLFANENLPVRLGNDANRAAEAPKKSALQKINKYLGDVTLPEPMKCKNNHLFASTPTLKEMSALAIKHLSQDNSKGFFLMIESASIDKQAHERRPCGSIGELDQLLDALSIVLEYAKTKLNTLVLVTSDHSHAAQIVPDTSLFSKYPIPVYTPGKLARILTPDGSVLAINYATSNFEVEEHTGANVPVFGNSVATLEGLPVFLKQPDLFTFMARYLDLE